MRSYRVTRVASLFQNGLRKGTVKAAGRLTVIFEISLSWSRVPIEVALLPRQERQSGKREQEVRGAASPRRELRLGAGERQPPVKEQGRSERGDLPLASSALRGTSDARPSCGLALLTARGCAHLALTEKRHTSVSLAPPLPIPPAATLTQFLPTLACLSFFLASPPLFLNLTACEQSDCLLKIERHTFSSTGGCPSLSKECFALKTKATLTRHCPGYSGIQISNAQETKKKEVTRNCLKQASQIQGWWRHFSQISGV
ncbi:thymic stromal lymphopoietin [Castor canadensis]|uniref:Thymic stromal lymphopoietin n=1 Tax=Castor canadensis TaxID=51338 RepID=A0AC58MX44_CASCN